MSGGDDSEMDQEQLDKLMRAVGLNPMRVRWRLRRWGEGWQRWLNSWENRSRSAKYQHKLCPGCGLNVDGSERVCPRCGDRLPSFAMTRLGRIGQLLMPAGVVTYSNLFVLFCVAIFLAMMVRSGGPAALTKGFDAETLARFGAWVAPLVAAGQWWRLVTAMFVHVNLLHLIFNCLWLVQLGPLVEQLFGRQRYLALCLTSGVVGFVASVGYRWDWARYGVMVPGAGASGVVFGLIATVLVAGYIRKLPGTLHLREGMMRWAIYGLIFSFLPQVDLAAHLGGAVGGGAMALILSTDTQRRRGLWRAVEAILLLVVAASFVLVGRFPGF